jgi:hypothetical protein
MAKRSNAIRKAINFLLRCKSSLSRLNRVISNYWLHKCFKLSQLARQFMLLTIRYFNEERVQKICDR